MSGIELERLTKSFVGAGRVVDDISLSIKPGEFVTLLGPSGCGKTTTLRLIAGFEYPDLGTVRLGGIDITDEPPYRRPVNTVFQDYALFPHMSIEKNVGYGMWVAGVAKPELSRRVEDALQMVGLTEKAAARPHELSGGQRQRVALARAIVRRPKVLLLDEPLSALDAKLREAMQVELRHLHRKLGITFVLVTHDQTEAMVMSDRVVIMERGRVVQDGTPVELYNRPATPYVASFLGTSNLLPAQVMDCRQGFFFLKSADSLLTIPTLGRELIPGRRVTLAIRPEKCTLEPARSDGSGPGSLKGKVIEHFFHGSSVRTSLDMGQGAPFFVDALLGSQTEIRKLLAPGQEVSIAIDPDSVIVFADGPVQ
jgi:putative spermidine/putrescine transport system ATP-binding protein/spermidine/putrescine transport system ATP-binding protein